MTGDETAVAPPTFSDWLASEQWSGSIDTAMPMLPSLALEVMQLAIDPEVSVVRIARVIAKDQVLATRVLRLANSAYCAPMQEVTTVNDAIVRMGTAAVRNAVLAVCFSSRMMGENVYGPEGRLLIDHGVGTAYLARLVAERAGVDPDEAFVCGLLHDIGKLLLLKLERDFVRAGGPEPDPADFETLMSWRHADLGARLLKHWNLPGALEEPVMWHHDPRNANRFPREAEVAYAANRLSHRYGFGCPADAEDDILEDAVMLTLGLDQAWLARLDDRAPGLFEVAKQIVG